MMRFRRLIAGILCLLPSLTYAQDALPPFGAGSTIILNGSPTTLGAALGRTQGAQVWRPVSTRAQYAYSTYDGGRSAMMTRMYETIPSRSGVSALKLCYSNISGVAGAAVTEGNGPATLTITASIEVHQTQTTGEWTFNSTLYNLVPATFTGNRTVVVSPGGTSCSDPISYPLAAGQAYYVRTYYVTSNGTRVPITRNTIGFNEGANGSYFSSASIGSSTTASTSISGTITSTNQVATAPYTPNYVCVRGGTLTAIICDNGSGNFPAGNGLASGTVNYSTGAISLTLNTAAAPNAFAVSGVGNAGVTAPDETLTKQVQDIVVGSLPGMFGPSAILGLSASGQPLGIAVGGDSINEGSGNTTQSDLSWVDYSLGGQTGRVKFAQPSERAADFADPQYQWRRLGIAQGQFDRFVENWATNDMATVGLTLSSLQTSKLAIWSKMATLLPRGFRDIYVAAVLPRTTSAASTTPFNSNYGPGTVASGSPSLRNAYNAWLCSQVGVTIGGVIDLPAVLENSPGTCTGSGDGLWKSSSQTFDGTHPSYSGYQAIGARYGASGTNPSPAFLP